MRWDFILAVSVAACQAISSILGWRVTVNPIAPEENRRKRIYEVIFAATTAVGFILVIIIARRAPLQPAHFAFQPFPTYRTERPASWAADGIGDRRASFLMVDQPLAFNVWVQNSGPGVAANSLMMGVMSVEQDMSLSSENAAIEKLKRKIAAEPLPTGGITLTKDQRTWTTARGAILSPEDYDNLVFGRRVAYIVLEVKYRDDTGAHTRHFCEVIQPPQPGGTVIPNFCTSFNDET